MLSSEAVTILNVALGRFYGTVIRRFMQRHHIHPHSVDAIASHGQTFYHAPRRLHGKMDQSNSTLQLGDGDQIARETGLITCSDFRMAEIAAGKEGAPLAKYGDYLLFGGADEARILLNIGGIANGTWLPKNGAFEEVIASDTGPGNTLIDEAVRRHYPDLAFDECGEIARSGRCNQQLLQQMLQHPFFEEPLPKTTGQETFGRSFVDAQLEAMDEAVAPADLIRTLTELTVASIANALEQMDGAADALYVSGGGVHNRFLIERLDASLPGVPVRSIADLGMDPDAKEAILFAALANERIAGKGFKVDGRYLNFGKLSLP